MRLLVFTKDSTYPIRPRRNQIESYYLSLKLITPSAYIFWHILVSSLQVTPLLTIIFNPTLDQPI